MFLGDLFARDKKQLKLYYMIGGLGNIFLHFQSKL